MDENPLPAKKGTNKPSPKAASSLQKAPAAKTKLTAKSPRPTVMDSASDDDSRATTTTEQSASDTVTTKTPTSPKPRAPTKKPSDSGEGTLSKTPGSAKSASMLGEYKLLKKIGQGGMGSVYKAQKGDGPIVAIKVLSKELANKEAYVARFEREARIMAKLDHANVLGCHSFGKDKAKGYYYIAMDFVEGGSVEGWLKKLGKFSVGDAFHIILKTAEGLQHAHEQNLIHRDIKPDNLLITKDGIVKVADLGLAKDTEEDVSLTKTGAGAGTPIYMAPEQARDVKHVDARVDIYALGVMFYVFLTGQAPFHGNTLVELIAAKEKGKFDPIRKFNDEVPSKVDLIVDKMLAKDPKLRFESCADVIAQLEPLGLHNESLSFLESEPAVKKQAVKNAPVSSSAKPTAATSATTRQTGKTSAQEEIVERDVWYWNMVLPEGKIVNKQVTTNQVKMLIKAGTINEESEISKTRNGSYRSAASFSEFNQAFQALKSAKKMNARAQKDSFKNLADEDARRRKWGWIRRSLGSLGGTLFGIFWILLVLGGLGFGGWYLWMHFIKPEFGL